ncbi:MAG: hypothetical protein QOJ32_1089 [Frankiaceae bacterium]|nr:hypothetical protein [Frankiaceae bacterium]MDQ1634280.1 hypothetical protein [Frankiaceae bacterium]MDQ1673259.1 hypothetical protein [Frankiaceae bacterium]
MTAYDERRNRILSEVGALEPGVEAGDIFDGVCRFAVEHLDLSGCALMLCTQDSTLDVLASVGAPAGQVAELQFGLGEGPCLDACGSGRPVFAADLASLDVRWPVFSGAACDAGVLAEFSIPLQVGTVGLGTLDLSRDQPGMLDAEHLADALVAADISMDAVLMLQRAEVGSDLAGLLRATGTDRFVVHQATGMVSVQLDASAADALASLRAAAFLAGRSISDVAADIVERKVTFYA